MVNEMRTVNVVLEDEDYAKLEKAKGEMGWREFIMLLTTIKVKKNGEKVER